METLAEPKPEPTPAPPPAYFTVYDGIFLALIALVFAIVTWLGVFTRQEALKTEGAKSNGEAWVTWFKDEGKKRFEANYAFPACAGGDSAKAVAVEVVAVNAAPALPAAAGLPEAKASQAAGQAVAASAAGTWGGCLEQLMLNSSLKAQSNPFTGKPPRLIETCVASNIKLAGDIDIDKSVATPAGSAVAFVKSNLTPTDSIKEKLQLSITVCDKGGYPIKISDVEF
jgi:hypothetical protein